MYKKITGGSYLNHPDAADRQSGGRYGHVDGVGPEIAGHRLDEKEVGRKVAHWHHTRVLDHSHVGSVVL